MLLQHAGVPKPIGAPGIVSSSDSIAEGAFPVSSGMRCVVFRSLAAESSVTGCTVPVGEKLLEALSSFWTFQLQFSGSMSDRIRSIS